MSRLLKLLALILIMGLLLVTGCNKSDNADAEKVTDEPLKIGLLRINDSIPFFVAQEEKLYEEYNVKVELVPFGSARDKDIALESGEIDAVLTDLIVAALVNKGGTDAKVVSLALGATPQEGRFAILAAPNSGIESTEDLKDVPIAISNNTIIHYLAEAMSQEVGLAKEDIKTQSIPDIKVRLEALLAGQDVKAALLPDPLVAFAEKVGAKAIIDDTKLETNLSQSVILFRNDVLDKRKEAVANVMQAYFKAQEALNSDPEKYRELIYTNIIIPDPLKPSYSIPTFTPGSLPTAEMVERVMGWMVDQGLLEKPYSYEEIVDRSFVKG